MENRRRLNSLDNCSIYTKCYIKQIREMYGLTQTQFADLVRTSKNNISQIENRQYFPSLDLLIRISFVFGLPLDDLVSYDAEFN